MLFRFAFRNLLRRPLLNLIKILGLSLSLTGIILISLFLKKELSYDTFHANNERIVRYTITSPMFFKDKHFARIPNGENVPVLVHEIPELVNYVRLAPVRGGTIMQGQVFYKVNQGFICDSTFFDVFTAPLLQGGHTNVLEAPGSMVLSETYAKKIFGKADPVGKIVILPKGQFYLQEVVFTVTGIMQDFPVNSHFHPQFVATAPDKLMLNRWAWTYFVLNNKAQVDKAEENLSRYFDSQKESDEEVVFTPHLQFITDIHLQSDKMREIEPNSDKVVVYTLAAAILLLLCIALINYANLNKGMAVFGQKFLHLSQVMGATPGVRKKYFITEALVITLLSLLVSLVLVNYAFVRIQQEWAWSLWNNDYGFLMTVVGIFSLLSLLSGVLPLLKFRIPTVDSVIKHSSVGGRKIKGVSNGLIVLQYAILTILFVGVLVISRQTKYAISRSMGVDASNVLCFEQVHANVQADFMLFKKELMLYPSIASVSAMFEPPGGEANDMFTFTMEGYAPESKEKENGMIGVFPCDYSFPSTFKLKFLAGTDFRENNIEQEGSGEYIINRSALNRLGYTDPWDVVGKAFDLQFDYGPITIPSGKIIGVVEDFHLSSLKKKIDPLVLFKRDHLWLLNFLVTYHPRAKEQALTDIESVWQKLFPAHPLAYENVRDMTQAVYNAEILQTKLLSVFTFIALVSCIMGLLGISLMLAQRRTKEIGVRKVNGASVRQIIRLLNWDLVKWILLAVVLAGPVAYWVSKMWLSVFVYRIVLSPWIFILSGLMALGIAVFTITLTTWRAASMNPVKVLRYE